MYRIKFFSNKITLLFLLAILISSVEVNAQKKKERVSSGAFTSYDKIFKGNINDINLADYADGPHFFWVDSKLVKSWYVDHKQESQG